MASSTSAKTQFRIDEAGRLVDEFGEVVEQRIEEVFAVGFNKRRAKQTTFKPRYINT
jgi:hypothetical protein